MFAWLVSFVILLLLLISSQSEPIKLGSADEDTVDHQLLSLPEPIQQEYREKVLKASKIEREKPPILLADLGELTLISGASFPRLGQAIPERRVVLGVVQFLTNSFASMEYNTDAIPSRIFVYSGPPLENSAYLTTLFPWVKFIFIHNGPKTVNKANESCEGIVKFLASPRENAFYCEAVLNESITKALAGNNVLFYIDINREHVPAEDVVEMYYDYARIYVMCMVMKPARASIKFRYPYFGKQRADFEKSACWDKLVQISRVAAAMKDKIDFITDMRAKRIRFFAGKLYLFAFSTRGSTETRLEISDTNQIVDYIDNTNYDSRMNYHNIVNRSVVRYTNVLSGNDGIDNCADCALEYHIWHEYFAKYPRQVGVNESVRRAIFTLSKNDARARLLRDQSPAAESHGRFYGYNSRRYARELGEVLRSSKEYFLKKP